MRRAKGTAKSSRSGIDRARALPWAAVAQAGLLVGRRLGKLSAAERERLATLVRRSGGRPGTLSEKERKELRKLAGKLDLRGIPAELTALIRGRRPGRRG